MLLPLISLQVTDWCQCHPRLLTVQTVIEWAHLLGQMQATHLMYNSLAQLVPIIETENRDVTYHWGSSFKNTGRNTCTNSMQERKILVGKEINVSCRLTSVNPAEKKNMHATVILHLCSLPLKFWVHAG